MVYPLKRRKMSPEQHQIPHAETTAERLTQSSSVYSERTFGSFSHGLQGFGAATSKQALEQPTTIEEVHVKVQHLPSTYSKPRKAVEDAHRRLHRRQTAMGTGLSSSITSPTVSVAVSINASGSLTTSTALPTATLVNSASSTISAPTETSTLSLGLSLSGTSTLSSGLSLSGTSTNSSSQSTTSDSSATPSATLSQAPDTNTTSSLANGMIGFSATTLAPSSATASTISPTSIMTMSSVSSNGTALGTATSTSSGSLSGLSSAASAGATTSGTSSVSAQSTLSSTLSYGTNFTTSAVLISNAHTTYTSYSTFALAPSGSSSHSSVPSSAATTGTPSVSIGSSTDLLGVILTTLSGGVVSTMTESRTAHTTTLSDGSMTTSYGSFVPISTTSSGQIDSDSSSASQGSSISSSATSDGSLFSTATTSPTPTSGPGVGGSGGLSGSTPTGSSASSTSSAAGGDGPSDSSTPPTPVLAGGIVGGFAGLAVLLLVAMLFLRWYRRRTSMHRLVGDASEGQRSLEEPTSRHGPGMAERAGLLPLMTTAGGIFHRHRHEPEEMSGERGFQRVSGRKLPSAFSEGMTSPPPILMPAAFENHARNTSNASFFRDSRGFYNESGSGSGENAAELAGTPPTEIHHPGPARVATLHPGGPYSLSHGISPPASPSAGLLQGRSVTPNLPHSPTGTAPRSDTPGTVASHGSRFTEEV